ncbi:hypothetical protein Naga_100190g1, partial [Nannochloropsis gaditana]
LPPSLLLLIHRQPPFPAFLDTFVEAAIAQAGYFDQQHLANFWLGCANLNYGPSKAYWAACREALEGDRVLSSLSLFETSTLLHALAVMDVEESRSLLAPLVGRATEEMRRRREQERDRAKRREMDVETESALRQLHQTYLYLQVLRREREDGREGGGRAGGRVRERSRWWGR